MSTSIEKYAHNLCLEQLFRKLGCSNPETLAKEVEHFTLKEAEKRDEIVLKYFGEDGVKRIVNTIVELLFETPKLPKNAKVLDVGAGSGFFTVKIAKMIQDKYPKASFYALDMTPTMLLSLKKKKVNIQPFIGVAENIRGSMKEAREYLGVPYKFDAIFSTLMLHHSIEPQQVFKSIKEALKKRGKAIILDLCKHGFKEFKTEMGDIHLGFEQQDIYEMAKRHFSEVKIEKMPGIRCECSGRSAEIFVAYML
ncbi:MAG: class I SAM-dependent methyltransferase [Candidatus Bathyarchaeales archaeon]